MAKPIPEFYTKMCKMVPVPTNIQSVILSLGFEMHNMMFFSFVDFLS